MVLRLFLSLGLVCVVALALPHDTLATGVRGGLDSINTVDVAPGTNDNFRGMVVKSLIFAMGFLALVAVVAVVSAGIVFIMGAGSDTSVTRARKIIIFTIIGLLIVFFARVIVGFFTEELANNITSG